GYRLFLMPSILMCCRWLEYFTVRGLTSALFHLGRCEMLAVLARGHAEDPHESGPHLLFVGEATVFSDRRDSIHSFLQSASCCVDTYCLDGFRRGPAARLGIKTCEVSRAHMYTFRKRLDSEVVFQMFSDPLFQVVKHVRIRLRLCGKQGAVLRLATSAF